MDEEQTNSNALQDVVAPEEVNQPETQPVEPPEDPRDKQWRELRQGFKELKRENQYLREQFHKAQTPAPKAEEEVEDNEPYITPKTFKRKLSELEEKLREKEKDSVSDRLRAKYQDFDEVVSIDNVEYLKQNEPELAASIASLTSDPYRQGIAAYKILKQSVNQDTKATMQDKAKIADNAKKPTSVQAVRKQGSLSDANRFANGLTTELKKALWQEMQTAKKGA